MMTKDSGALWGSRVSHWWVATVVLAAFAGVLGWMLRSECAVPGLTACPGALQLPEALRLVFTVAMVLSLLVGAVVLLLLVAGTLSLSIRVVFRVALGYGNTPLPFQWFPVAAILCLWVVALGFVLTNNCIPMSGRGCARDTYFSTTVGLVAVAAVPPSLIAALLAAAASVTQWTRGLHDRALKSDADITT